MKPSETSLTPRPQFRDIAIVAILIVGVCCFALTPAMYLLFRALEWERGLRIVEAIFPPAFLLFGVAALFAYRRHKARRVAQHDTMPTSTHS